MINDNVNSGTLLAICWEKMVKIIHKPNSNVEHLMAQSYPFQCVDIVAKLKVTVELINYDPSYHH
jgi:hypothetical protein